MLSRELWSGRVPGCVTAHLWVPMQRANVPARSHKPPPVLTCLEILPSPILSDGCHPAVEPHSSAIRATPERGTSDVLPSGSELCPGRFPCADSSCFVRLAKLSPTEASLRDAVAAVRSEEHTSELQ